MAAAAPEPCRRCGAPVVWARTDTRKFMPLDAAPTNDRGAANCAAYRDAKGVLRVRVLRAQEMPHAYEKLAVTHFATCTARTEKPKQ